MSGSSGSETYLIIFYFVESPGSGKLLQVFLISCRILTFVLHSFNTILTIELLISHLTLNINKMNADIKVKKIVKELFDTKKYLDCLLVEKQDEYAETGDSDEEVEQEIDALDELVDDTDLLILKFKESFDGLEELEETEETGK